MHVTREQIDMTTYTCVWCGRKDFVFAIPILNGQPLMNCEKEEILEYECINCFSVHGLNGIYKTRILQLLNHYHKFNFGSGEECKHQVMSNLYAVLGEDPRKCCACGMQLGDFREMPPFNQDNHSE